MRGSLRWFVISTHDIVLFDLDGTVATGNGPVIAYARLAAADLPEESAAALVAEVQAVLTGAVTLDVAPRDGYDLVRLLAERAGITAATLARAYQDSRELLGTPAAPVAMPEGLAGTLRVLRGGARTVLATNAPGTRLDVVLTDLGLDGLFDVVETGVGKPVGMTALLDRLGVRPAGGAEVLSVGDVWANDLAPVHARGHATALVGPPPAGATPTYHAPDLPGLYPSLRSWVDGDRSTTPAQHTPLQHTPSEGRR